MRSLGCALIQYDYCPYKRGKCGDRHTGRMPCEDEGRDEAVLLQTKEQQRLPANYQNLGERHRNNSLSYFSE